MAGMFQRLKQRKLVQWALAYVAFAFALLQGVDIIAHQFDWPGGVQRGLTVALAIGLLATLVLAWYHGERGLQEVGGVELVIIALLLAVGGGLLWRFANKPQSADVVAVRQPPETIVSNSGASAATSGSPGSAVLPAGIPAKSIAVLPLVNTGGEGQQFFSDGLSEALIIALSQFDGLKVIGRNSSFRFRDTKDSSASIGRKLGVAHLLEGSVQHAGDLVRVSVELIRAADGSTVWSQRYDRPYKGLFALQDDITQAVAGALHAKLLAPLSVAKQIDRPPSGSLEAYNAYLQGLKYWHEDNFIKAAGYMTQAVQIDPGYAMAWADLAGASGTVVAFSSQTTLVSRERLREARAAADKALQLAPGLGPAHAARAYLAVYTFDHQVALAECRRAVQLSPDDGTVLNGCGFVLAQIGKLGQAIRLREHLLSIEPLYNVNNFFYARLLMATGRLDESEKYLRIAEGLSQPYPYGHMAIALLRGDAHAAMEIATRVPADDRAPYLLLAAQIGPDRAAADAALAQVVANDAWSRRWASVQNTRQYAIAQAYALRGDADKTLEWLQRAAAHDFLFLLSDPIILRFRDDPRLIAFCRQLGLPLLSESDALSIDRIRADIAERN